MTLFGTDGIRGKAGTYPLTATGAHNLGSAFARLLQQSGSKAAVGIARDTRASSPLLEQGLVKGLATAGTAVHLYGVLPTAALAFLSNSNKLAGAVMVTASHNPAGDNGLKFFGSNGEKLNEAGEKKIERLLGSSASPPAAQGTVTKKEEGAAAYVQQLLQSFPLPVGLRIVVDCGNGAASFVAPVLFSKLGAEVTIIHAAPDGSNINDGGAMQPKRMAETVKAKKAVFGVAFDGDADRAVFADEKGNVLNGDNILAMLAMHLSGKGKLQKKTVVVTDYSNSALSTYLNQQGITAVRVQNGDKYVYEELKRGNYSFGGEQSGHFIFAEHATTGDGLLTALHIAAMLQETGKPLSALAAGLTLYPQCLLNVNVREKRPLEELDRVQRAVAAGNRKLEGKGRIFLRYSGTEMKLRILIEGPEAEEIKSIAAQIATAAESEVGT